MFCPNCGKRINDDDNFCKYCGHDLRDDRIESYTENSFYTNIDVPFQKSDYADYSTVTPAPVVEEKQEEIQTQTVNEDEEIVVYEIKKHYMALFWPCVFSPVFIAYFWIFYVNIPSILGFLIALVVLMPIVYPILRYYSDRSVVTTQNLHIRQGVFSVEDICVPLNKIHLVRIRRSFLGRMADYGHLIIEKENSDKEIVYRYIQDPEDVEFILRNPKSYIEEYLKQ